jgi:hypothetical protein
MAAVYQVVDSQTGEVQKHDLSQDRADSLAARLNDGLPELRFIVEEDTDTSDDLEEAAKIVAMLPELDRSAVALECEIAKLLEQGGRLAEQYATLLETGIDLSSAPFPSQFQSQAFQDFND